jgi:hypothetical protein
MDRYNKVKTKCDFCQYKLGTECVAVDTAGKVSEYKCKQAQYEYNQWLWQQKQKLKPKSWH